MTWSSWLHLPEPKTWLVDPNHWLFPTLSRLWYLPTLPWVVFAYQLRVRSPPPPQGNFGRHDAAVLFSFSVRVENLRCLPQQARTPNIMVTYLDELNPTHTTPAPEYPTV